MASKEKNSQKEYEASLIPVIENQEQQLRAELEQARRQADNQKIQVEKQAEQLIQEGRFEVSELVERRREKGLRELQKRAEQLSHTSTEHSMHLQQQVEKNMARAVQIVVDAVTGVGGQT